MLFENNLFTIQTTTENYFAKLAAGTFGKRSNVDIKWNRKFIQQKSNKLNNYIGVKYHIQFEHPENIISLHNFKNGYGGFSKIEEDKYCLQTRW